MFWSHCELCFVMSPLWRLSFFLLSSGPSHSRASRQQFSVRPHRSLRSLARLGSGIAVPWQHLLRWWRCSVSALSDIAAAITQNGDSWGKECSSVGIVFAYYTQSLGLDSKHYRNKPWQLSLFGFYGCDEQCDQKQLGVERVISPSRL